MLKYGRIIADRVRIIVKLKDFIHYFSRKPYHRKTQLNFLVEYFYLFYVSARKFGVLFEFSLKTYTKVVKIILKYTFVVYKCFWKLSMYFEAGFHAHYI